MVKIAIVGPESSGKTSLAEALMRHYNGGYVSEVAREYLEDLGRPYEEHDLLAIARSLQELHAGTADMAPEQEAIITGRSLRGPGPFRTLVFYDTDTLNMRIWSQEKYGRVHPEIDAMVRETGYTWRLLCRPDIPWKPDPLRENPHDRDRLFAIWERELQALGFPFTIIEGTEEQRMRLATNIVDVLLQAQSMQ
jgi:nicotinamide riboside kinase